MIQNAVCMMVDKKKGMYSFITCTRCEYNSILKNYILSLISHKTLIGSYTLEVDMMAYM